MRHMRKHIRNISGPTGPYTIRAKVIEKTSVCSLDDQALELQIITFQDEEGTKMKTIMREDELEVFDDVIHDDMEYDISNAMLKMVPGDSSEGTDDRQYEIFFNINTMINLVSGSDVPAAPNYILIGSIPRTISLDDRYDILGVVIYVDRYSKASPHQGHSLDACEVVLVDHSHEQVMIVTTWSDVAIKECAALQSTVASFPVVGLTALMPCYKKGFSLLTTHSTFVILDPPGEEAESLRVWAKENRRVLAAKNQHIFEVRLPETSRTITAIERLLEKQPNNTLQEEHHWLHVRLNEFTRQDVHLYLGCSECGTGNIQKVGPAYACLACFKENVCSTPKIALTFEVADETGQYTLTAYTKNAETLLELKDAILYSLTIQEREGYLDRIGNKLRTTKFYVQVVPTTALSQTQELKWVLKQVSLI